MLSFGLQANEQASVQNLYLKQLSVNDGLSQGTVNSILTSDSGFVWLATDSGINLYDGYSVKQLPGPDKRFIDSAIYLVKQDSQGLVWINVDSGLYRYQPKENHYQLISESKPEHFMVDFIEGKNVSDQVGFWLASSKTISFYHEKTKTLKLELDLSAELPGKNNIFQIKYHEKILYISTRVGMYAYHIESKQWRKLPSLASIQTQDNFNLMQATKNFAIFISEQGDLYIGSNDGVYSVNTMEVADFFDGKITKLTYKQVLAHVSVWQMLFTNEHLHIASNKGLHKVNTVTQQAQYLFSFSDYFDHVSNNAIISLAVDKSGIFWLGSESTGVYLWDPNLELVNNYRYQKNNKRTLTHNEVWTFQQHSSDQQQFWVGTSSGLNLIDNAKQTVKRFMVSPDEESQFSRNYIYQIYNYEEDILLLSTSKGIVLYNTQLEKSYSLPSNEQVSEILSKDHYSVYFQEQRYLWLVYAERAVVVDLVTGLVDELSAIAEIVPHNKIFKFLGELPNSKMMLFSTNDTLWGYNLVNKQVHKLYQHPNVLASEWISYDGWVIDKNNILWLSYPTKGLLGLELSTFNLKYFYHNKNNIIDNNVYSLMTDEDGDLWFSTHKGLFVLNIDTQHIRQFTVADGLSAMEFNSSASLKLANGKLVYGSMEGVSIFSPEKLKNKFINQQIKVYTTGVDVISRQLDLPLLINQKHDILLEYDDVGIRFDFSTLSFSDNQGVTFEYQLTGDSRVNYPATTDNRITFPSLPSGSHILHVKAKSPITGEYSQTRKINILVSYAPWKSPFAYFIYFFIFSALLALWIRHRTKQKQQLLIAHEEVTFRENRLQLALTGSNSEVWDWQADGNLMFGKRIAQELAYVDLATAHSFTQHVDLIHPDDKEGFISKWRLFIENNDVADTFSCTYRLKHAEGNWLWYKDLGKIVTLDHNEKPSRITGSYTNITETRAEEVRSQYYGEAFRQTNDWVLIINDDFSQITANQSLRSVFELPNETFGFSDNFMGLNERRWQFFKQLFPSLAEGEHWRGEELVVTASGEEFHVVVNINVGRNETTKNLHYVCVFTDISAQKSAEKELRYLANYDHLTDLPNRSLLLERIKHAMESSQRQKKSIAVFFIDLDRFKQVNDSLGHDCGDLLLVEVSRRLSELLRVDDTVARIGGDEFVVLVETFRGPTHLGQVAQKIIAAVEKPVLLQENEVCIGASIGIALYPDDASDSSALLRHADVAMYHAKQLGRNTFQFFTPRMNAEATERLTQESKIKLAYSNDEFFNHYQPIIDSKTGKAAGFELLMRWQSQNKVIAPAGFISIAEELGLIIPMTEAALERGLEDLKAWHKQRPSLYLSVNLSAQHFAKESLVIYISRLLKLHDLPAHLLKIEVTESALITEPEKAIRTMNALSDLGVILALDDFGTGFSSLSYLKRLPLDIIKVDRSFIAGIGVEKTDEAIVDATIVLARRLNMHCIAEGVETTQQLDYLTKRNCYFVQGYLYSKPVDAQTISDHLSANVVELKAN